MGVRVKGLDAAMKQLNEIIADKSGRKVIRGITEAMMYVGAASAAETPRDTSTLVNSQFREVEVRGGMVVGIVGYAAKYAWWVHEKPGKYLNTQTDRPVKRGQAPGSRGVIWGPHGNPKFLYWPLQDAKDEIPRILARNMKGD